MRYKGYNIEKVKEDLGEESENLNYIYRISKNNKVIIYALTLNQSRELINSNFNEIYL